MPWKIKITGPGVDDFEFVWEGAPTELPPVDLPEWPAVPQVNAIDEALPEVAPPPEVPIEPPPPVRQRITVTPSPRDPIDTVMPPSRQLEQPLPDAIDQVMPSVDQPFEGPGLLKLFEPSQEAIDAL